jgi:hypothetical protein
VTPALPVRAGGPLPAAKVCLFAASGQFVHRLTDEQAEKLRAAGLAEMCGSTLRMIDSSSLIGLGWRGGSHTMRRIRNDAGVIVGAPRSGLEHRPLRAGGGAQ